MIGSVFHRNWGVIAKCPHCGKENVPKVNKMQFTCGSIGCRAKQNTARERERTAQRDHTRLQANQ